MVLKFQGYWDDRSEFGDVRKLEICYYLSDDTIDIKEHFPRNSGREGPSTFLKRCKLPRVSYEIKYEFYNSLKKYEREKNFLTTSSYTVKWVFKISQNTSCRKAWKRLEIA